MRRGEKGNEKEERRGRGRGGNEEGRGGEGVRTRNNETVHL